MKLVQRNLLPVLLSLLFILLAASAINGQAPLQVTNEIAKLLALDGEAGDRLGFAVAVSGDTAVVGAPHDSDNAGSAYVFVRNGTSWDQQAKLLASDGVAGDVFGTSVAVSGDTVVVSAKGDDDNGNHSGSAYVFVRSETSWSQQAKLLPTDGTPLDQSGVGVAVSGDTVVLGADGHPEGDNTGAAYVFVRSGTSWSQQAKLLASDGEVADQFGISVAVAGDTAVVGATVDDNHTGSAYVFVRSGTVWSQQAKLLGSGATSHFGLSVAVSGDTAVVGGGDLDGVGGSGAAWVFVRSGTSWSQQAKMLPSDGAQGDQFGGRVAVSGDVAVAGASQDDDQGTNSGSAYVFRRNGTSWSQQTKLLASDGAQDDWLGAWSVAVSGDTVVVAADLHDDQGENSGAAYVFDLDPDKRRPTADAGPDQAVRVGDKVLLDGSGSFDDNTPSLKLSYQWSFAGAPTGSMAVLTGANTPAPSFVVDVLGTYLFELVVTDEEGLSSPPDEVLVSSDNLAPTADAGDDVLVITGTSVTLDALGSSDPEDNPLSFFWSLSSAPAGSTATLSGATSATAFLTPDVGGQYEVVLVVHDFIGPSEADTVVITATTADTFAEIQIESGNETLVLLGPTRNRHDRRQPGGTDCFPESGHGCHTDRESAAGHKPARAGNREDGWLCAQRSA